MKNLMKRFIEEESGATMVEYAIMVAVVSIAALVVLGLMADQIINAFQAVVDAIAGVLPA